MDITIEELKGRLDKGENVFLVDVREDHERALAHIGGLHIPMGQIPTRLNELVDHQDSEIVVYCRSGNRSGQIAGFLRSQGYENVRNMIGGMLAWKAAYDPSMPIT